MSLQSNFKNLSPLRSRQLSFPGNHVNVLHIQWPGPTHQNWPPPLTVRFSEFCLHHHHQCLDSTLYTASPPPQIWRHHDAVSPPKTFTFSYCAHGNKIFSVRSKWRPSRSKCRDVSVCGAVSSSVRLSSLSLTVCSQRTLSVSSHQHFWYQTKHIVLSFTSKDWIRFTQHCDFFFYKSGL